MAKGFLRNKLPCVFQGEAQNIFNHLLLLNITYICSTPKILHHLNITAN